MGERISRGEEWKPRIKNSSYNESGAWVDTDGNIIDKEENRLRLKAEGCGCGQCKKRHENYVLRMLDDYRCLMSLILTVNTNFALLQNPDHKRFRYELDTGDVWPVSDEYPDCDDVFELPTDDIDDDDIDDDDTEAYNGA